MKFNLNEIHYLIELRKYCLSKLLIYAGNI